MSDRRRNRKLKRTVDEELARRLGPPAKRYPTAPKREIPPVLASYAAADAETTMRVADIMRPTPEEIAEDARALRRRKIAVRLTVALAVAGLAVCVFMLFK